MMDCSVRVCPFWSRRLKSGTRSPTWTEFRNVDLRERWCSSLLRAHRHGNQQHCRDHADRLDRSHER